MNRFIATTLLSVIASTVLANTTSGSEDSGHQTYRRVVLGESTVALAERSAITAQNSDSNPGSYARYLIHLGLSERDAIARAHGVDAAEAAPHLRTSAAPMPLDSREVYEKTVLGHSLGKHPSRRTNDDRRVVQEEVRRQ